MDFDDPKVYGDTSITDGLVFTDHEDPIFRAFTPGRLFQFVGGRLHPHATLHLLGTNQPVEHLNAQSLLYFSSAVSLLAVAPC